jgi:hypothetical protein
VDTVPWDLIKFPETPEFDWETAVMAKFQTNNRIMRDYVKKVLEKVWQMQVRGTDESLLPRRGR